MYGSNKISLLPPFLCQYFQNYSDIGVGKTTSPDLCICVVYTPMLTRGEECRNRWYVIYGAILKARSLLLRDEEIVV